MKNILIIKGDIDKESIYYSKVLSRKFKSHVRKSKQNNFTGKLMSLPPELSEKRTYFNLLNGYQEVLLNENTVIQIPTPLISFEDYSNDFKKFLVRSSKSNLNIYESLNIETNITNKNILNELNYLNKLNGSSYFLKTKSVINENKVVGAISNMLQSAENLSKVFAEYCIYAAAAKYIFADKFIDFIAEYITGTELGEGQGKFAGIAVAGIIFYLLKKLGIVRPYYTRGVLSRIPGLKPLMKQIKNEDTLSRKSLEFIEENLGNYNILDKYSLSQILDGAAAYISEYAQTNIDPTKSKQISKISLDLSKESKKDEFIKRLQDELGITITKNDLQGKKLTVLEFLMSCYKEAESQQDKDQNKADAEAVHKENLNKQIENLLNLFKETFNDCEVKLGEPDDDVYKFIFNCNEFKDALSDVNSFIRELSVNSSLGAEDLQHLKNSISISYDDDDVIVSYSSNISEPIVSDTSSTYSDNELANLAKMIKENEEGISNIIVEFSGRSSEEVQRVISSNLKIIAGSTVENSKIYEDISESIESPVRNYINFSKFALDPAESQSVNKALEEKTYDEVFKVTLKRLILGIMPNYSRKLSTLISKSFNKDQGTSVEDNISNFITLFDNFIKETYSSSEGTAISSFGEVIDEKARKLFIKKYKEARDELPEDDIFDQISTAKIDSEEKLSLAKGKPGTASNKISNLMFKLKNMSLKADESAIERDLEGLLDEFKDLIEENKSEWRTLRDDPLLNSIGNELNTPGVFKRTLKTLKNWAGSIAKISLLSGVGFSTIASSWIISVATDDVAEKRSEQEISRIAQETKDKFLGIDGKLKGIVLPGIRKSLKLSDGSEYYYNQFLNFILDDEVLLGEKFDPLDGKYEQVQQFLFNNYENIFDEIEKTSYQQSNNEEKQIKALAAIESGDVKDQYNQLCVKYRKLHEKLDDNEEIIKSKISYNESDTALQNIGETISQTFTDLGPFDVADSDGAPIEHAQIVEYVNNENPELIDFTKVFIITTIKSMQESLYNMFGYALYDIVRNIDPFRPAKRAVIREQIYGGLTGLLVLILHLYFIALFRKFLNAQDSKQYFDAIKDVINHSNRSIESIAIRTHTLEAIEIAANVANEISGGSNAHKKVMKAIRESDLTIAAVPGIKKDTEKLLEEAIRLTRNPNA